MLESAGEHLKDIGTLYNESLKLDYVPKKLTNKIRYFLNDIESALDYISFEIFTVYCLPEILESESDPAKIEKRKKRVNYPFYDYPEPFKKRTNEMFPKLKSKQPEILQIFENQQPFVVGHKDYWLPVFNKLNNYNKHRNLTKQRKEKTSKFSMQYGSISIIDATVIGSNTTPVNINNTDVDFINPSPYDHLFSDTSVSVEYFFKDLGVSVLPTLHSIYDGATSIIRDLEKAMKGD